MRHDEIVIQDREELYYLLSEAAEFEHSVMCTYLYALWSLKRDADETDLGWFFLLDSLIFQTEARVRWLDACEERLKRGAARQKKPASLLGSRPGTEWHYCFTEARKIQSGVRSNCMNA